MFYYSQNAIDGFGKAMAARYGVQVEFGGTGAPCTDGTKVTMPDCSTRMLKQEEFEAVCGIAIHELSHCLFESVPMMKAFIDDMKRRPEKWPEELSQACFNAAIDVQDESRIEYWDRLRMSNRSAELLAIAAADTLRRSTVKNVFRDASQNTVWQALVINMYKIRKPVRVQDSYDANGKPIRKILSGRQLMRWVKWADRNLKKYGVNMDEIHKQLRRCVATAAQVKASARKGSSRRLPKQNRVICEAAEELVKLLKPFWVPGNAAGQGDAGKVRIDVGQSGMNAQAAKANGCAEKDGADLPQLDGSPGKTDGGGNGAGAGSGAGSGAGNQGNLSRCDEGVLRVVGRYVSTVVHQVAQDDKHEDLDGQYTGNHVGQVYRVATDNRILARTTITGEDHEGLSCAILLDTSGSMSDIVLECAAVVESFRRSINAIGGKTKCFTFSNSSKETPGFEAFEFAGGGTVPNDAMKWSRGWLKGQSNRNRYVVIATDGDPVNYQVTADLTREIQAIGAKVIVVYLGGLADAAHACAAAAYPGATIVTATDPNTLGLKLTQIARRLAAAR